MDREIQLVLDRMIQLYAGDAGRIQHFIKVHAYAAMIGREEQVTGDVQKILEIAAIVHDIGIHECERRYGRCDGTLQEKAGPPIAEKLLREAGIAQPVIDRVSFLVAHHHTYAADAVDWQILLEADFLVNGFEGGLSGEALQNGYRNIFQTESGKRLCRLTFGLSDVEE